MTAYLLENIPVELHADLKKVAERQRRTIRQVLLFAIEHIVEETLGDDRLSARSSNGRTSDFGSEYPGPNPGRATKRH